MISNSQTREVSMDPPQAGTWILAVKTLEPEKVVWQKDITFSSGQLMLKDVRFEYGPHQFPGQMGKMADTLLIQFRSFANDRRLANRVHRLLWYFDGKECVVPGIASGKVMMTQEHTVGVSSILNSWQKLSPGERHSISGRLLYGDHQDPMDFRKEFVVPASLAQQAAQRVLVRRQQIKTIGSGRKLELRKASVQCTAL